MSDPFSWSIPLGRVSGTPVRVHFLLAAFVGIELLDAALTPNFPIATRAGWISMLILALAVHELGHIAVAARLGHDLEEIQLWPLGNFVGPSLTYASRSTEALIVAAAGPVASLLAAVVTAIGLNLAGAQMVFNPFGNAQGGGAPLLAGDGKTLAATFTPLWYFGWFGYLNWVLFLANLIPALPLDNGRIFRGLMEGPTRDGLVGNWTARTCAILLGLIGLIRVVMGSFGGWPLVALGILIYMVARLESRMLEDGGYLDDTVFGYDFSQGYTSLEAGAATVRPRREGALHRWRRRRSEIRKQRRAAKEAAQEQRMDEILEKLHRDGRSSLTDEEQRFLVRVSSKYKNRPKIRD